MSFCSSLSVVKLCPVFYNIQKNDNKIKFKKNNKTPHKQNKQQQQNTNKQKINR